MDLEKIESFNEIIFRKVYFVLGMCVLFFSCNIFAAINKNEESNIYNYDSSIPNLNQFYDLNSRDIEHSLVYWSLVHTDNDDNYTGEDLLSIFIPEVFNANPFERERIKSKFLEDLPKIKKHLMSYKDIEYVSIPISFSDSRENWIIYAREDMEKGIYYDEKKQGFYNFCPINFVVQGPVYGNIRGAVSREVLQYSFDNRSMKILYKKNKYDDDLCFLSINDKVKAENIYNANYHSSLIVKGRVYLKLSSITNPENKSMRLYVYDDKGGLTYDKQDTIVAEIVAIDLELYDNYDNYEYPKLIYKGITKSASFYK